MILAISPAVANGLGFAGAGFCLAAYLYASVARRQDPLVYHGLNLVGALLLIASLLVITNAASLSLDMAWAAIGAVGLARALWSRRR